MEVSEESAGRGIVLLAAVFYQYIVMTVIKNKEQRKFVYNIDIVLSFNFFTVLLLRLTELPGGMEKSRWSQVHES